MDESYIQAFQNGDFENITSKQFCVLYNVKLQFYVSLNDFFYTFCKLKPIAGMPDFLYFHGYALFLKIRFSAKVFLNQKYENEYELIRALINDGCFESLKYSIENKMLHHFFLDCNIYDQVQFLQKVSKHRDFHEIFDLNLQKKNIKTALIITGLSNDRITLQPSFYWMKKEEIVIVWQYLVFQSKKKQIVLEILKKCEFLFDQNIEGFLHDEYLYILKEFSRAKKLPDDILTKTVSITQDIHICEYLIKVEKFDPFDLYRIMSKFNYGFYGDIFDLAISTGSRKWFATICSKFYTLFKMKKDYRNIIHFCFRNGFLKMIKYLLNIGINIYVPSYNGLIAYLINKQNKKLILKFTFLPKSLCTLITEFSKLENDEEIKEMCILQTLVQSD